MGQASLLNLLYRNCSTLGCKRIGNSVIVVGSGIEEVGNCFYGSGSQDSFSTGVILVFETLFEGSGGDDEPSVQCSAQSVSRSRGAFLLRRHSD